LELARSLGAPANRVFLIFFVSLALLWGKVWPQIGEVSSIQEDKRKYKLAIHGVEPAETRLTAEPYEIQTAFQEKLNQARKESLDLPGGYKLDVPVYYVPLVWSTLCLILFAYLNLSRRRHFALIGRALRVLRQDVGYTEEELHDLCPSLPWWLIPLPRENGEVITAEQFRHATGWISEYRRRVIRGGLALVGLVLLQFLTLWVAWQVFQVVAAESKPEQFLLCLATLLVVALTLICLADWLLQRQVPDHLAVARSPHEWNRRTFLISGCLALLTLSFLPVSNVIRSFAGSRDRKTQMKSDAKSKRLNPRFRRTKPAPVKAPSGMGGKTALLNKRSGIIHYVRHDLDKTKSQKVVPEDGQVPAAKRSKQEPWVCCTRTRSGSHAGDLNQPCLIGITNVHPVRFTKISLSDTILRAGMNGIAALHRRGIRYPRLHRQYAGWALEQEAEEILKRKNPDDVHRASELLFIAIEQAPLSLRLYDRLAALSVEYRLANVRQQLINRAREKVQDHPSARFVNHEVLGRKGLKQQGNRWTRLWVNFVDRAMGRAVTEEASNRPRQTCRGGTLVPRAVKVQPERIDKSLATALQQRIEKWENPQDPWYQKWASGSRKWKLPQPAERCKQRPDR
jgi:hypothetical protein